MAGQNVVIIKIRKSNSFRGAPILASGSGVGDLGDQDSEETNTMTIKDPDVNVGMAVYAVLETANSGQVLASAIAGVGEVIIGVISIDGSPAGPIKVNYFAR